MAEIKTTRDFHDALRRHLSLASNNSPVSLSEAKTVSACVETTFIEAIQTGGKILIPGIGHFEVKATAPRQATNPLTGAKVDVPAGHKLTFKPVSAIKAMLKGEGAGANV